MSAFAKVRTIFYPALCALGLLAALPVAASAAAAADEAQPRDTIRFDIRPQPLARALQAFASQASMQLLYRHEAVEHRSANAVIGTYDKKNALRQLIQGTGLEIVFSADDAATIRPRGAQVSAGAAQHLQLVQSEMPESEASAELIQAQAGNTGATQNQDEPALPSLRDSGDSRMIEEIIVTARKTRERLQDVPISVTALTSERIEEMGAVDVKDVLAFVPGLSFSNAERGLASYTILGIANAVGTPTTGIFMNEVPVNTGASFRLGAFDPVLFDIERVEVLKGPQGTLYGGSAMGGVIKYVAASPDLAEMSGSIAAGIGTVAHGDSSYNAEGVLNLPIVAGVLGARAGIYYLHEGGYIDNVVGLDIERTQFSSTPFPTYTPQLLSSLSTVSKDNYNATDTVAGRFSLLWEPDPSWSIRPEVFYQKYTQDNPSYLNSHQNDLVSSYRFNVQERREEFALYSLDVTKQIGPVELTSVTSYWERDEDWDREYTFFMASIGLPYTSDTFHDGYTETNTFQQELRLASAPGLDTRLEWLVGMYYSDRDFFDRPLIMTPGAGYPSAFGGDDVVFGAEFRGGLKESALFGDASYAVTEKLSISAGLRYFEFEQEQDGPQLLAGGLFGNGGAVIAVPAPPVNKEDGVNPKFGLSYKVDSNHLLYFSAAKGFRVGGAITPGPFSAIPGCLDDLAELGIGGIPDSFESDSLWTYQLGSKNEFAGGRVMLNGALVYSDWKDIQQNVRLNCGAAFTANAGEAEVKGVEFETRIDVTAGLQLGTAVSYMDATITKIDPGFNTGAVNGDEILDTPEWTASIYGSYTTPITPAWDLQLYADYQHRGRQRQQFNGVQTASFPGGETMLVPYAALFQESYDQASAFVSVSNGSTALRLYVRNAFDERPLLAEDVSVGISRATTLRPRTIGLELRQKF